MRMVTPKKTKDGDLKSPKHIISKKSNNSLVKCKDVIVDNVEGGDAKTVTLHREPVLVVPIESKSSENEGSLSQTVSPNRELVSVSPSRTKRSDIGAGGIVKKVSFSREPVLVVSSETKCSDSESLLGQKESLRREPVVLVPSKTKCIDNKGGLGKKLSLSREPVLVVSSKTKRSDSEGGLGQIVSPHREPAVVVPKVNKRNKVNGKKKVRFSISKMKNDTNFKVTLSIKKEDDGSPVFFKVDGNRFKKEMTIKLMVETPYRVDFCFKPTQTMTQAVFRGQEIEATEKSYDSMCSAYSARLCVQDIPHSQKGHREDLGLGVQLKGGLSLQTLLQVKYYKSGDSQHCEWGSTFHCLELDCETHADAGLVAVLKETFR